MPKIGLPSSAMYAASWIESLKVAIKNEFDAYEVGCEFPNAYPDNISPEMIAEARELLSKREIEISVHDPGF